MKRLLGILMILILIAGVFVSCSQDKIEEAVISGEELLDVSFGAASGRARDLVVDTPTFNDGDYIWYYTAKKADTTGFKTGETLVKTPVKDPAAAQTVADRKGLSGAVISGLSQGYWDFGLYAYVPDTSKAVDYDYTSDYIAWQGSVTHFLLVKGAANVVDVTVSPSTQGKGWLVVDVAHIYIKDGSGALPKPVTDHPGTSLVYTVTPFGGTTPVDISEPIDAGAYLVKVVCTGSNIDYAEDSIVVNVYSGLTRTVSGWIGELTTSATFGDITGEIIEATTGSKSAEELEAMAEGGQSVAFVSEGTVPVTASLPASAAVDLLPTVDPGTDLDLTLTLNVKADAESTEQEVTTKSYDITLVQKLVETTESSSTTTVSNVTDPLIEYLTATLTIDKNLSAVSVKHSNVSMVDLAGATAPTDEQIEADAEAGYPGFYNYDSATGVLTLITKKFSPFQVSFTKPVSGIARVTRIVGELETTVADCKSLDDAFELALDGDTVVVLADTTRGATKTVSKEIGIKVVSHIKDVTDPLMLVGRGYEGTYNTDSQLLTIKKTPVTDAVARIDDLYFKTLQEAIDVALDGETIVVLQSITTDDGYKIDKAGMTINLDVNGETITVNNGSNVNYRAFRIDNGTFKVYGGGTIDAKGQATSTSGTAGTGCYGAFRAEIGTELYLENITLKNYRPWGLNVKILGAYAELDNVTIVSVCGGGIEVTDDDGAAGTVLGYAKLTNCIMEQSDYRDWCSVPVSVSGNSTVDVYSTSYIGEYGVYVFSSGGTINIYGGTFASKNGHPVLITSYETQYDNNAVINVYGGSFTGPFQIGNSGHEFLNITGGTFDHDPIDYVEDGYWAFKNSDSTWTVRIVADEEYVDIYNMKRLEKYIVGSYSNGIICNDIEVNKIMELGEDKVLDLNGKTLTVKVANGRPFVFSNHQSMVVDANGGQMIIPEDAPSTCYGLFRLQSSNSSLVLNGGTYKKLTNDSSAIVWVGNTTALSYGVKVELNGISGVCIGQFVRDSAGAGNPAYSAYHLPVNTVDVNDSEFTFNNAGIDVGGSVSGFVFLYNDVVFDGVTIVSDIGSVMELDGGNGLFRNNSFTTNDPNPIQEWNGTTIGISYDANVTIESGTYTGPYGVSIFTHGGNLTIEGGTITGNGGHALDLYPNDDTSDPPTCIITGNANLKGDINVRGTVDVTVTGGTFDHDPSAYVADGYEAVAQGTNPETWVVVKAVD